MIGAEKTQAGRQHALELLCYVLLHDTVLVGVDTVAWLHVHAIIMAAESAVPKAQQHNHDRTN